MPMVQAAEKATFQHVSNLKNLKDQDLEEGLEAEVVRALEEGLTIAAKEHGRERKLIYAAVWESRD